MTFTPTVVNEDIREFCDSMPEALGKTYIINSLKSNGFKLIYVEPNWLFISWHDTGSKILIADDAKAMKKQQGPTKKIDTSYKSIDSYKPTGSVYGQSALMGFGDKLKL